MTNTDSAASSSGSPEAGAASRPGGRSVTSGAIIPADFIPDVAASQDHLRCADCKGYTVHASIIGIVGRFCSCAFDREHT